MARGARCSFSSQAIMCVQLLSWCVAACLLLYRGVSTLRKDGPVPVPDGLVASTAAPNDSATDLPAQMIPEDPAFSGDSSEDPSMAVATALYTSHMSMPYSAVSEPQPQPEPVTRRVARLQPGLRPASLILIVLGFSMLLVGPVVIILRKCDSTLHHRRAVKVSTDEEAAGDPPPSYEEATAGTGAPRYSTLFEVLDSGELVCLNAPHNAEGEGGGGGDGGDASRNCEKANSPSGSWECTAVLATRER